MFVYILSNKALTFYIGVTNDLGRRVFEHKESLNPKSFTSKYNIKKLVYFEFYESCDEAILREKYLKRASRKEKFELIRNKNPNFKDLYNDLAELLENAL